MTQDNTNHPVESIQTIRVSEDDVIKALKSEYAEKKYGRDPLVLRITGPFDAEMSADLHRDTGGRYPHTPAPIHIPASGPRGFIPQNDKRATPSRADAIRTLKEFDGIEDPSEDEIERVMQADEGIWASDMKAALRDKIQTRTGHEIEIKYTE